MKMWIIEERRIKADEKELNELAKEELIDLIKQLYADARVMSAEKKAVEDTMNRFLAKDYDLALKDATRALGK